MLILITYDVNTETAEGRRRLTRVAKVCKNYGQRVQNSVFECELDNTQFVLVRSLLLKEIDEKSDSLRLYHLGNHASTKVEEYGNKHSYDPQGTLLL